MNGAAAVLATLTVVAAAVALAFVVRGGGLGDRTEAGASDPQLSAVVAPAPAGTAPVTAAADAPRAPTAPAAAPPEIAEASAPPTAAGELPAVTVLRRWDKKRARAYADGSVDALRELYRPGSDAGRDDVRLLRDYRDRGYRVVGMRMQLLAVDVLEHRAGLWRLRVTDRLVDAVAVGHEQRIRLPHDQASTRVLTLVRYRGQWRVGAVR
jgi:hypothetical protein